MTAASDINDARIKRHTATWAPDDHQPRKGPHRLARSSTRRRLYAFIQNPMYVEAVSNITMVVCAPRDFDQFERLEPGDLGDLKGVHGEGIRIYGDPTAVHWAYVGSHGDAWGLVTPMTAGWSHSPEPGDDRPWREHLRREMGIRQRHRP